MKSLVVYMCGMDGMVRVTQRFSRGGSIVKCHGWISKD